MKLARAKSAQAEAAAVVVTVEVVAVAVDVVAAAVAVAIAIGANPVPSTISEISSPEHAPGGVGLSGATQRKAESRLFLWRLNKLPRIENPVRIKRIFHQTM